MNKVNPDVNNLISPIVYDMTRIKLAQDQQKRMGVYNKNNEPDDVKIAKRRCVHIVFDGSGFNIAVEKNDEGKLVCACCGREIATDFSDNAVSKIADVLPVINQLLLFGMLNGLQRKPIENLIALKMLLPDAAKLMSHLCDYVSQENANARTKDNVGAEYQTDLFGNGITGLR
jgi:hypothetical protein